MKGKGGKAALALAMGVSRSTLYYQSRKDAQDWQTKIKIEEVLREHPAYGTRNIARALARNRKPVQRVMRRFGIKPYRRWGRRWRKTKRVEVIYPNLLLTTALSYPHHIWAADFTEIGWRQTTLYLATVIDLFTRETVGVSVSLRKGAPLTLQALYAALNAHPRPVIFHSDNGKEYAARSFVSVLGQLGVLISRTHPGCPWENGYQESFYGKFKVELGDPNRFFSLGELVAEIYRTVWVYNHTRIHSALKMPPKQFAKQFPSRIIDIKSVS